MLTYWSHIFTCLTSSECRSRNRFLCQFVWTTETVPILYNWLLQQFSFNIIETLHSDCTHIEDCIFYFGRFPHFVLFCLFLSTFPPPFLQTDSIIPIDDFWWSIIIVKLMQEEALVDLLWSYYAAPEVPGQPFIYFYFFHMFDSWRLRSIHKIG